MLKQYVVVYPLKHKIPTHTPSPPISHIYEKSLERKREKYVEKGREVTGG